MRAIHTARIDKVRPVLLLTRANIVDHRTWLAVAPITSTQRGLSVEVWVGPANGLDKESVVNLDDIQMISVDDLGPRIGQLLEHQEPALAAAVFQAFDLRW